MKMRIETDLALQNVMDCFTGADGGGRFLHLKTFIEHFDNSAKNGDISAEKIIDVIIRMSRLIDVANKEEKRK